MVGEADEGSYGSGAREDLCRNLSRTDDESAVGESREVHKSQKASLSDKTDFQLLSVCISHVQVPGESVREPLDGESEARQWHQRRQS